MEGERFNFMASARLQGLYVWWRQRHHPVSNIHIKRRRVDRDMNQVRLRQFYAYTRVKVYTQSSMR